jgi:hypothetical protein
MGQKLDAGWMINSKGRIGRDKRLALVTTQPHFEKGEYCLGCPLGMGQKLDAGRLINSQGRIGKDKGVPEV